MATLKESMQTLHGKTYNRVKRNDTAYALALSTTTEELTRLINLYRTTVVEDDMRARLLRDSIDHHIRRYHGYSVRGKIKSHYYQDGVSLADADCIFEHVIPAGVLRDKLLEGVLTINQVLNAPTCRLSRDADQALRKIGLHDDTPDGWFFFKRYKLAVDNIQIKAYNQNNCLNLDDFSLEDHFALFGVV